jgi:TonB-linked SusC/RagA family outer membrane protein
MLDNNRLPPGDLTSYAMLLPPDAPSLYNNDGSLNWAPTSTGSSSLQNPLVETLRSYQNKTYNLVSNAVLSYNISRRLDISSSFGYTNMQTKETIIFPLVSVIPEYRPYVQRSAQYGNNGIISWIIEPQLNYKKSFGSKGKLDALMGTTIQHNNTDGLQLSGSGYISDDVLKDIKSAATVTVNSTTSVVYKYNALFGRLGLNWNDKYLVNIAARRDGSSRFGAKNQFHNFASIGLGWIFSQENFSKKLLPCLSFGKLRASYGTTGNDQIGEYKFLNLYSAPYAQIPYQGAATLLPNGLPNPYLQWEETRKLQAGIDLGLINDRISLNATYYHNRSSNQLLPYTLSVITGAPYILRNFPATVQNMGWELMFSSVNLKGKDFVWSTTANVTIPKNKLIAFDNLENSAYANSLIIGKPLTIRKVYHFLGVDPVSGIYQFADSHGNPTTSPNGLADNTEIINTAPEFYGGLGNHFKYKGIELDILFQFVKQKGPNYFFGTFVPGVANTNQPSSVLGRWRNNGDITQIQKYNSTYSLIDPYFNAAGSDAAIADASFIRLKNLSLSWELPAHLMQRIHLKTCKLFAQGQNLLTISKYKGLDPETKSTTSLPPLKIITIGLQVSL